MKKILFIIILALILSVGARAEDKLLEYAKSELKRSMAELSKEQVPPYYISFNITDVENYSLRTSFGKTEKDGHKKERILDIDLRVGDYNFDNTHIIRGNAFNFGFGFGSVSLPLTNDEKAIKAAIWYAVDKEYKKAVERYQKAVTNKAVKIKEEDSSADFSKEKPQKYVGDEIKFSLDTDKWKQMIPKISAKFSGIGWIYTGETSFEYEVLNKWFVSSEGAELRWAETNSRIMVYAKTKAEDGMSLPLYKSYFAFDPKDLPQESKIAGDVDELIATMDKLRKAPLAEPYSGPAILSGEASGVFFHEIFGHRVEGHREKDPNSSQTFKNQIGKKILPDFIDVIFDPTVRELGSREISGFYQFDDQGTKSQRVETVKNGVFQKFLMARSPIDGFPTSNGHGRKQAGYPAVSRQSNLIVQSNEAVSGSELKELLRKECKQQNKEYGLYFDVVEGGFTFTGREIPNAFNVNPLVVYKVFADGRPDEIVRGVDLIGTPLTTFSNIIKAGGEMGTFNGICGAESGGVPVSASSNSLLVSLIEVQRKQKSQAKLPILNAPESGRP